MPENRPVFILVRPQMGENIGAAARAMWNFGLRDLRLVAPRDGWPNRAADDTSSGALDEMGEVRVFSTLAEAAADVQFSFAVTARPRDIAKPVFTPNGAIADITTRAGQKTGFVLGPERTGLENDEVALCHAILTIPANPAFPALNLAQSVLLIAWEIFKSNDATAAIEARHEPAKLADFEAMFARLEGLLKDGGFFKTDIQKPTMIRNLRAMLMRGEWSEQEIRTFQGILSALTGKNKV